MISSGVVLLFLRCLRVCGPSVCGKASARKVASHVRILLLLLGSSDPLPWAPPLPFRVLHLRIQSIGVTVNIFPESIVKSYVTSVDLYIQIDN